MQKTKTHLTISNISFFSFLLLFSIDRKLGKFYSFANYKILIVYTKMIPVQKIKTRLETSNIDFLHLEVILVLTYKLGKFYSFCKL